MLHATMKLINVLKGNPNHGKDGKFASGKGATAQHVGAQRGNKILDYLRRQGITLTYRQQGELLSMHPASVRRYFHQDGTQLTDKQHRDIWAIQQGHA